MLEEVKIKKMNKLDFIRELMKTSRITEKEARRRYDDHYTTLYRCLNKAEEVNLVGHGKYKIVRIKEREAHNPKNISEKVIVPERNQVFFSSGNRLREAINR